VLDRDHLSLGDDSPRAIQLHRGDFRTLILEATSTANISGDSDEGANTRLAMDFARIAFYQKLALVPFNSFASGSTDLKLLDMDMRVPVHMPRLWR
jgi:hypothetical protein